MYKAILTNDYDFCFDGCMETNTTMKNIEDSDFNNLRSKVSTFLSESRLTWDVMYVLIERQQRWVDVETPINALGRTEEQQQEVNKEKRRVEYDKLKQEFRDD